MVKHIVLWKIRDGEDKQKNIESMIDMLTSLVGKIEGLVSMEVGYDFSENPQYDVALYASFKNPVALKYYQNHPEHLKCKDFIGKISVERASADYFYEKETSAERPFDEVPDAPTESTSKKKINDKFSVSKETVAAPKSAAPVPPPAPVTPAAPKPTKQVSTQTNPVSTENQTVTQTTSMFGKKKIDVQVTPLEQRSDTWTCPNCGKVMPNYVGTCGCGEPKPFDFDVPAAPVQPAAPVPPPTTPKPFNFGNSNSLPNITPEQKISQNMSSEEMQSFSNAEPSLQSYNPQIRTTENVEEQSKFDYIKNDRFPGTSNSTQEPLKDFNQPLSSINFDNAPPPAPMRFDDAPPAPMRFDDTPPAPMRFDDTPPAPMKFNDTPPAPMSFNNTQQNSTTPAQMTNNNKKKHRFGKKAKEEQVIEQAQAAVINRKDVPNDGTWTCPNCGKVMPNYVGTCGCGEQKPFDF